MERIQSIATKPSISEIEHAFRLCIGREVSFRYIPQTHRRNTMSRMKAARCTEIVGDKDEVTGLIERGAVEHRAFGEPPLIRLQNRNRRKIGVVGRGYLKKLGKGQVMWRCYKATGVRADTLQVRFRGKMIPVFPLAEKTKDKK